MVHASFLRRLVIVVPLVIVLLGTLISLGVLSHPTVAHAATCRDLGVYTDWLYNTQHNPNPAPAIWIWNNGIAPTPSKMTIYYNGWWQETVPSPDDWGVRTDAPQLGAGNGWLVYYIAGRWY